MVGCDATGQSAPHKVRVRPALTDRRSLPRPLRPQQPAGLPGIAQSLREWVGFRSRLHHQYPRPTVSGWPFLSALSLALSFRRVLPDNGPAYLAQAIRRLSRRLERVHHRSRPYTPPNNGKAGRGRGCRRSGRPPIRAGAAPPTRPTAGGPRSRPPRSWRPPRRAPARPRPAPAGDSRSTRSARHSSSTSRLRGGDDRRTAPARPRLFDGMA